MAGSYNSYWDVNVGCSVAAIFVVAGLTLTGCGVTKCVKYLVNKDKSKQSKEVVVSSNQSVMGSDTIRLNAVAMNQHTK